jgi:hypothetical protein
MEMIPPHNDSIWPDDTKRAAVTLALAAATNSDMQFRDVIDAIKHQQPRQSPCASVTSRSVSC